MPGDVFVRCCVQIVQILPCLLRSVVPVLHQQKCLYGYRNDQWGDSCFQGEMQKSTPWIDTGDERHSVSIGHFRCFAVIADSLFRFVIQWN